MKFLKEWDPQERVYCNIAAAVIGSGVLSAGASIWGSTKAAEAQTTASQNAINYAKDIYNQNKALLSPYVTAGTNASDALSKWINPTGNNPLSSLIKLTTPGSDMNSILAQTPGYEFTKSQGERSILNALAGRGLGGSIGAITKGVGDYTSGLASTTWQNVVSALSGVVNNESSALQNQVNSGVSAGSAIANSGNSSVSSVNSAITGAGNAQAASYNSIGSAVGSAGSTLTTAALIKALTGSSGSSVYGGATATTGLDGLGAIH